MEMKVYSVEISLESPLILATSIERNIYQSNINFIPGKTLRGAILSKLYRDGFKEIVGESSNPTLIFHPAYPFIRGKKSVIAHAFTYQKKTEDMKIFSIMDDLELLKNGRIVEKIHLLSKNIQGHILFKDNGDYKYISLKRIRLESTSIEKNLGKAREGMLYTYEAVVPWIDVDGKTYHVYFSSKIIDVKGDFHKYLEKSFEKRGDTYISKIFIGKGISRGFGEAKISIKENKVDLDKRASEIERFIEKKDFIVIESYTPFVEFTVTKEGLASRPYIEKIDLSSRWIGENGCLKIMSIDLKNEERILYYGSRSLFSGWSIKLNRPTPIFSTSMIGSLYVYSISDSDTHLLARGLAKAELVGLNRLAVIGLNIPLVLLKDPLGD
ncbi:MAG TPA: hypothetical protein ENG40_00400 [Thermoprotei archaeon]|nr:hypothetical protein [Thermoprotei archaeon]